MRLYKGDCLEIMDKLIADGVEVDAIITDPPYGTTACKWDSVIPFDEMWERLNKLIKPNGAIVLFGSEPFSSALRMSNIKNYKYDWIWEKSRIIGHLVAKIKPMTKTELISVFALDNNRLNYYPQKIKLDKPIIDRRKKGNQKGECQHMGSFNIYEDDKVKIYTDRYPLNLLKFKSEINCLHPTQKPIPLMEYLIKTYTNEGNTVLDFTMGSGSTGVAAKNTNRRFIGIEMDDTYFEIAKKRIEQ